MDFFYRPIRRLPRLHHRVRHHGRRRCRTMKAMCLSVLQWRCHSLCRRGFALNFLSTCSESRRTQPPSTLHGYFRCFSAIDWCCRLRHDYRRNDFTLVYVRD